MPDSEPLSFPCKNCGRLFLAKAPYEGYDKALAKPCPIKDHDSPQLYVCEDCKERNVLYWCSSR